MSLSRRLFFILFALLATIFIDSALVTYKGAKIRINKDYDAQLISECHLLWTIAAEENDEPKGLSQIDLNFGAPSMSAAQRTIL